MKQGVVCDRQTDADQLKQKRKRINVCICKPRVSFRHGSIQDSKGFASFCGVSIWWLFQAGILPHQQPEISPAELF